MGISGLVGAEVAEGLKELLTRQLLEARFAEEQRQARAQEGLAGRRLDQDESQFGRKLAEDSRQFGVTAGQGDRRLDQADRSLGIDADRLAEALRSGAFEREFQQTGRDRQWAAQDAMQSDPETPAPLRRLVRVEQAGISTSARPDDTLSESERDTRADKEMGREIAVVRARGDASTSGQRWVNRNGEIVFDQPQPGDIPHTPPRGERPVTGQERKTFGFYERAKDADGIVVPLEEKIAQMGLGGQAALEYLPNFMQGELGQSYRQAQRAFTEARLRQESGAAVPQSEYDNDARTYFAQPGDKPETIKQKQASRQKVLQSLGVASGRAYDEFYGESMARPGRPGGGTEQELSVERGPDGKLRVKR